jgi:hypothetical protein
VPLETFPPALAWAIAIFAGLFALPYVLGPVLIRYTQTMRVSPTLVTFDPEVQPAPPAVQQFLDTTEAELWDYGFEAVAHVALPDMVPNVKSIIVIMVRPESNDAAMGATMFGTGAGTNIRRFHVEFSTDFADGFEVATSNTTEESVFKPLPHKRLVQCDFVRDPVHLWRVHERAVREYGTGPKKPVPTQNEAIECFRASLRKEITDQAAIGWLYYDEENEVFRPTWKGACLMTWKLCWPVSLIRRVRRRQRAKQLLADWNLETIEEWETVE